MRRGDRSIELTRTEFTLLEMFLRRPRRVLERSFILEEVWGYFGAIKSVTAVPTPDCKATCVKYAVVGAKGSGSVYFSLTVDINRWFVAHFDISPPPP